uniref:Aminotransferase-like plant mobile domain-containing protein n=1 Tax=Oryza brachyantha TaxID=4533 RepID=J3N1N0_ORYBR
MHWIAGLPLDGEFYEEFIPPRHEQDPSMLLYPKCLSQLLKVWEELQVGGVVSLQEWRADLCIVELYHPDRVAQQFRLDQLIPYHPLKSLYTAEDFGIAYAYWAHLLHPTQQDLSFLPTETHIGSSLVYWIKWYRNFFETFSSVLDSLSHGNVHGMAPYEDRIQGAVDRVMVPRRLSSDDFFIVKVVSVPQQAQYVASIKAQEHNLYMHPMEGSSSQPIIVENLPMRDDLVDDRANMPLGSKRKLSSELISSSDQGEPSARKKLDFSE